LSRLIGNSAVAGGGDTLPRIDSLRDAGCRLAAPLLRPIDDVDFNANSLPDTAGSAAARECAAIASDLERLKLLIADAGDKLLLSFSRVMEISPRLPVDTADRAQLDSALGTAVTALQFQDMCTQLTQHAQGRLAQLEQALSTLAEEADDPLIVPAQMQPVRQEAMGAGSIELF
jgi:hypothetical protein